MILEIANFKRLQSSFVFQSEKDAKILVQALLAMVKADVKQKNGQNPVYIATHFICDAPCLVHSVNRK